VKVGLYIKCVKPPAGGQTSGWTMATCSGAFLLGSIGLMAGGTLGGLLAWGGDIVSAAK
jgi:hypothetical protein